MDLQKARQISADHPDSQTSLTREALSSRLLKMAFRFRLWLHVLIYVGAFAITWLVPHGTAVQRVWLTLPEAASAHLPISLHSAIVTTTGLATLLACFGALLRTWGGAYLGEGVVFDPQAQSHDFAVSGPFRHVRNPLYLGTMLHTLALCLLMSWEGAVFAILAIAALQMALILSEERFLTSRLGSVYGDYAREVPRLAPRVSGVAARGSIKANWTRAFANEIYMWGTAISFAVFGSTYNAFLILQGVMVSFGLSIVVRGLMGKAEAH